LFSGGERLSKSKKGEEGSDGLLSDVQGIKLRKSVISRRLEAGRTIHLRLKTKAQLLTIISRNEQEEKRSRSLIIGENQTVQIVLIADPFAPHILMYVSTVESPYNNHCDWDLEGKKEGI